MGSKVRPAQAIIPSDESKEHPSVKKTKESQSNPSVEKASGVGKNALPKDARPEPKQQGWGFRAWLPSFLGGTTNTNADPSVDSTPPDLDENDVVKEKNHTDLAREEPPKQQGFLQRIVGDFNPFNLKDITLFDPYSDVVEKDEQEESLEELCCNSDSQATIINLAEQPNTSSQAVVEKEMEKADEVGTGFFNTLWNGTKNAAGALGNAVVWAAESPVAQAFAAFSGGAAHSMAPDEQGIKDAVDMTGRAIKVVADSDWSGTKSAAGAVSNAIVWAAESPVAQAFAAFSGGAVYSMAPDEQGIKDAVDMTGSAIKAVANTDAGLSAIDKAKEWGVAGALFAANKAVDAGYGDRLVGWGKSLAKGSIDTLRQIEDRFLDLRNLTDNDDLATLLLGMTPRIIDIIEQQILADASPEKQALWERHSEEVEMNLSWALLSGAANLFAYMDAHPIPEVDNAAEQLSLSPAEKLGYYIGIKEERQLLEIEGRISRDIEDGNLVLSEDSRIRALRLTSYFEPLAEELIDMAFGDQQELSIIQRFIVSQAKGVIATEVAKNFHLNQGLPSDRLESWSYAEAIENLNQAIGNPETVAFLDNSAEAFSLKLSKEIDKRVVHELLADYPEILQYLEKNPQWQAHFAHIVRTALLKQMTKRIEERSGYAELGQTPADAFESIAGTVLRALFSDVDRGKVVNARKIVDKERREKKLRKIFKPAAQELYQLLGPEQLPIPFPSLTKPIFEQKILGEVLPLLLADLHEHGFVNPSIVEDAKTRLREVKEDNHAEAAIGVATAFIRDLVPHMIADESENLAKQLVDLVREQLMELRIDAYIEANRQEVMALIGEHLHEKGRSAEEADISLFMNEHADETRQLVLGSLREQHGEEALAPFIPKAAEVDAYISQHESSIQQCIANNLRTIGDSQAIKSVLDLTLPLVEGAVLDGVATVYQNVKTLGERKDDKGRLNFLPNLSLRMLNTATEFMCLANEIRAQHGASSITDVSHEEMTEGFGYRLHKGVPATPEALEARRILIRERARRAKLLHKLDRAKKERTKAKSARKRENAEAKIALCRRRIKASDELIKNAEQVMDMIREENMKDVVEGFMQFAGIQGPEDLKTVPEPLRKLLHPILMEKVLPKIGVEIYKKAFNPHNQHRMVTALLKIAQEGQNVGGVDRLVYTPPQDDTQKAIDEAIGKIVQQCIAALPKTSTYAALEMYGIDKVSAPVLGGLIRQTLGGEGFFLELLELGIKEGLPNLLDGYWETDAEGKPVFKADAGEIAFTFPKTDQEKEEEAIKLLKEEIAAEKEMRHELAKTLTGQMKWLVKARRDRFVEFFLKGMIKFMGGTVDDALPQPGEEKYIKTRMGLWHDLQALVDDAIEDHLGSFGIRAKQCADVVCRFFIITVLWSLSKAIVPVMYKGVFWIIEKYIEYRGQHLTDMLELGIMEDLYLRLVDDFIEAINNPENSNTEGLINELVENAEKWEREQAEIEEMEHNKGHIAHVAAMKRELQRIWKEEPNRKAALRRMATKLRKGINTPRSQPLFTFVGTPVGLNTLPASSEVIANGLEILSERYEAVRIAADGHCLFRGVALELLRETQEQGEEGRSSLLRNMRQANLNPDELTTFEQIIGKLYGEEPLTPDQIMNGRDSNVIVQTLRHLACAYNSQAPRRTELEPFIRGEQNLSTDEYFANMGNMHLREYGGEPELQALAQALQVELEILDVKLTGEEGEDATRRYGVNGSSRQKISLLYYSDHYTVAREKLVQEEKVLEEELA